MQMQEFLSAVASGKTGFQAKGESEVDLAAFQSTARTAEKAYDLGYIAFYKPHQESYSANRYIDALVASDLTDEGRQYLSAADR